MFNLILGGMVKLIYKKKINKYILNKLNNYIYSLYILNIYL